MVPRENPDERFRHRRARDPLKDQTPGIGKQPYRQGQKEERPSLNDDDDKSTLGNREREAGL